MRVRGPPRPSLLSGAPVVHGCTQFAVRLLLGSALVACLLVLAGARAYACHKGDDDKGPAHQESDTGDDHAQRDDGDDRPPRDAAPDEPDRRATQEATATTRGSAVADTGGNVVDGG